MSDGPVTLMAAMDVATISPADAKPQIPRLIDVSMSSCHHFVTMVILGEVGSSQHLWQRGSLRRHVQLLVMELQMSQEVSSFQAEGSLFLSPKLWRGDAGEMSAAALLQLQQQFCWRHPTQGTVHSAVN